jgi:hypothetical protein
MSPTPTLNIYLFEGPIQCYTVIAKENLLRYRPVN